MQIFILSTVFVTTHDFTKINCMKVNKASHYSNFLWKYSTYFFDNAHFRYEMSCQRCRHNRRKYLKLWKLERNTYGRFAFELKNSQPFSTSKNQDLFNYIFFEYLSFKYFRKIRWFTAHCGLVIYLFLYWWQNCYEIMLEVASKITIHAFCTLKASNCHFTTTNYWH